MAHQISSFPLFGFRNIGNSGPTLIPGTLLIPGQAFRNLINSTSDNLADVMGAELWTQTTQPSIVFVYNGSSWVAASLKTYNGTSWVDASTLKYNGSSWV